MADLNIKIRRIAKKDTYTISKWYVNGVYFCDGIEDKDRGLKQSMSESEITRRKVYGQTAIPTGTYSVITTYSPKFASRTWARPYNGCIPILQNVKGFTGVRIHPGNTAEDSLGCLLPGKNKIVGKVIESSGTFHTLMSRFILPTLKSKGKITLTIE